MKAEMEIEFESKKSADAVLKALDENKGKRMEATIKIKKNKLIISIKASDVTALRAGANSYLRILQMFESLEGENK